MPELKIDKIEQLIAGAILTGIAVVIGHSWGDLIQALVNNTIKRIKCGGKKGEAQKQCRLIHDQKSKYDSLVMSMNALCTTVILVLVMIPLWKFGFTIDSNKIS